MATWDYVLVGGGLQNGLIALGVLAARPDARVLVLERAQTVGGNHTWSFHEAHIPPSAWDWFGPLIEHRWPRYRVQFPGVVKDLSHPYATCSSERFAAVVGAAFARAPNAELRVGAEVVDVGPRSVTLGDGTVEHGTLVVDARGPREELAPGTTGWQKFVGLEVEVDGDLDVTTCELMDATVEQLDGFRFIYLLPFGKRRALVEDTRFSDEPTIDVAAYRSEIERWLAARGLALTRVLREESGALPMPWRASGPIPRQPPIIGGYRGGWFHPATGYSVPVALKLATFIAARAPEEIFADVEAFDALATAHEGQARFGHLLNDLLFNATRPTERWKVFRHFYELDDEVVLRFYGAELSAADKRRMFFRKPPPGVSYLRAMGIFAAWGAR